MALPPPGARQTGPYDYTGPTQEEIDAYRQEQQRQQQPAPPSETNPDTTAPPPAEGGGGDGGGSPAIPPPPPMSQPGAGGGAFEGSFAQPGSPSSVPFRTPEFFSGRISTPQVHRMGPGSPISGMVDLGGGGGEGNPFQGEDDMRRLLASIIGGRG